MKITMKILSLLIILFWIGCSSTEEKSESVLPQKTPAKTESDESKLASLPQSSSSQPSSTKESTGSEESMEKPKIRAESAPKPADSAPQPSESAAKPADSGSQSSVGTVSKDCEPFDEENERTKCTGKVSSLKGETFLPFELRKANRYHIGLEVFISSGELQVLVPGADPGKATSSRSFIYLGAIPNTSPLKIQLKADQEVKGIEYRITIYQ